MEVEEETTTIHLEESKTTTVVNQILIGDSNTSSTENESNTRQEPNSEDTEPIITATEVVHCRHTDSATALSGGVENSVAFESVNVAEDSNGVDDDISKGIGVTSDDTAVVEGGGGELTGSGVGESIGFGEDLVVRKDEDEVTDQLINESDDVAAVECGGGDLACAVDVPGEPSCDLEEDINGKGETLVVRKDEDEGGEGLKDCEVKDQFNNESDTNIQLEDNVDNVEGDEAVTEDRVVAEVVKEEGMVADEDTVGSDVGNEIRVDDIDNVEGDEAVTEEQVVAEVVKEEKTVIAEEQVVAEVVKEEEMVADKGSDVGNAGGDVRVDDIDNVEGDEAVTEEQVVAEVVGEEKMVIAEEQVVAEVVKEEEMVADKGSDAGNAGGDVRVDNIDNVVGDEAVTEEQVVAEVKKKEEFLEKEETLENDEKDIIVEDEVKSLDTEIETEKSLDTEMKVEKSLDTETEIENEKSLDAEMENEKPLDTEMENEKSLDKEMENEKSLDKEMENEKSLDTEMEPEKSLDTEMETEKSQDTEMENDEEANLADEDKVQEADIETESSSKSGGGKRKRGKATSKSPATQRKIIEDDVCFICYDGGDLVLCDRRNCPKAYHAACVNRDEAFFQSKGAWTCGWHLCSHCEKKAEYMCYTCTHSLCKACAKTSDMLCVREKEKRGLCSACIKVVMAIEKEENQGDFNFDDKSSWEHLFKDYWIETKAKCDLTLTELEQAKSFSKDDNLSGSDNPPENQKTRKSKRNTKKHKSNKEDDSVGPEPENAEWVSKDLLEFVTHMRNGDTSAISQSEVQDMLFEYIKRNKLRDPSHKSQIICDARLENLFGKPRVAHIEMLKLLESHFLVKEDSQIDEVQGTVVDTDVSPVDDKDKKRKGRKKSDRRGPQSNREDYAAIDIHNINLIYLRRKLVEDLLDDMERFHDIIVGTFVRIRISGAHQKQDMYRLVQVTGTSEASWYTLSKRTTCTMLEILNLDKKETISIDSISNQDFMEDECKRLRQSIKCGLINRLTVGDVLDKAMELQPVRVNDWFETEIVRLNHLRDRASDLGRKKELRECVEKLTVLKTPEERARRLEEVPLIHEDPTMDPEYGSEDDTDPDDKKQESYKRSDSFRFNRRGYYTSKESWSGTPRGSSGRSHDFTESWSGTPRGGSSGRNHEFTESRGGTPRSSSAKNLEFAESWSGTPQSSSSKNYEFSKNLSNRSFSMKAEDATTSFKAHKENSRDPFVQQPIILEKPSVEPAPKINESEKMWHYKDPSEKIQGPFSMVQLRKWSKSGYFPDGLKIWRKSDKENDGILLTDALEGKFKVVDPRAVSQSGQNLTRNLPSPTPNKVNAGRTAAQTGPVPGSGPLTGPNPPLVACGNNDGNLTGSVSVSTFQSHDPSTNTVSVPVPVAVAGAPQNVDPGVQNPVQSYQLGQAVAPPDSNMQAQMVQSVSGQNPQGWPQNIQPNPSMNMAGLQPMVYNQWPGVPTMVQNPVGNFMAAPQDQWAQQYPFPVNQPMMQQPQQQLQPNLNWGAMAANPNMGWVGPNTGNPMNWAPMVQGPQVTGAVDPNWVMQAGWVGPMPTQSWVATPTPVPMVAGNGNPGWVGPMPPGANQVAPGAGWVAPNANQVPPDMNTGWVGGPANQGAPVPNQGWVPPAGNQGLPPPPGTASPNWGPRNHGGNRGGNENRGNHSGQRRNRGGFGSDGNRSFNNNNNNNNQQESFHRDGGSMDNDDGSARNDGGSVHGDGSKTSDQ